MKKDFTFRDRRYSLEMGDTSEADGDLQKCPAKISRSKDVCQGTFKLTKLAWETAQKKAQDKAKGLNEILVDGCIGVVKAELYIREPQEGFSYVTDHRFFQDL